MAAGGTDALVLIVDPRRGIEGLLQTPGAVEGRDPPLPIDLPDRFGNLDLTLSGDLLHDQRHWEEWLQVGRPYRLVRSRMKNRRRRHGKIRNDIVPMLRNTRFVELIFDALAHMVSLLRIIVSLEFATGMKH